MKMWLLNILLGVSPLCFSQHRAPQRFIINFDSIYISKENLINKFQISTFNFKDSLQFEKNKLPKDYIVNYSDKYMYVYIYKETKKLLHPQKESIIRLSFYNKSDGREMNIYFKINHNLNFGSEIEIRKLKFVEGNYLYDMTSKGAFYDENVDLKKSKKDGEFLRYEVFNLENIGRHKISNEELNEAIKNSKQ